MSTKTQFLKAVLGDDGAHALLRATERSTALENALVPRTILAWIGLAARTQYEGSLPGIENSYVAFKKSEDGFSGQISIGDEVYDFKDKSVYHLAASVAVSMGVDHERVSDSVKSRDLKNLGKSIDLLVKARVLTEDLLNKRVLDPSAGYSFSHVQGTTAGLPSTTVNVHAPNGEHVGYATFQHTKNNQLLPFGVAVDEAHQRKGIASAMYAHAQKVTGGTVVPSATQTDEGAALWRGNAQQKQFGKVELPGQTAKPTEAAAPIPPDAPSMQAQGPQHPQKQKPKLPKLPKTPASVQLPKLKLSEAQLQKKCPDCDGGHIKNGKFIGCMCWRDLAKNTTLSKNPDGTFTMSFGASWDRDAFEAFVSDMRVKS